MQSVLATTARGRTYRARAADGGDVALKEYVFLTPPVPGELEVFEREGRMLEQLAHPALPRFIGIFFEGEGRHQRAYLAQELIAGTSLFEQLLAHRYTESEALDVARNVLPILQYLETRNPAVVHRDVKPANLIGRPDGTMSLVDFGAARGVDGGSTHRATLVGTFGYLPPEQLAGIIGPTTDTYALGATVAHLLTRRAPAELWTPGRGLDVASHVTLSPRATAYLAKMLALDPAARFPSAAAALTALNDARWHVRERRRRTAPAHLATIGLALAAAGAWALTHRSPAPTVTHSEPTRPTQSTGERAAGPPLAPRAQAKRIHVGEHLPRVAMSTMAMNVPGCSRFSDLAIDDLYVSPGDGQFPSSVLIDASFLKLARASASDPQCQQHVSVSGDYVHLLQGGGRTLSGSDPDSVIYVFGSRQSKRFALPAGAHLLQFGFGDPFEPTDVLSVNLDLGEAAIIPGRDARKADPAPLLGDLTAEWEAGKTDPELYFLRKTARKFNPPPPVDAPREQLAQLLCRDVARARPGTAEWEPYLELASSVCGSGPLPAAQKGDRSIK